MKSLVGCAVVCFGVVFAGPLVAAEAAEKQEADPVYDIPLMEKIVIDGKADDWGREGPPSPVGFGVASGFRVEMMKQIWGDTQDKHAADHNARFRLGWNRQGLLILATITDDKWIEYPKKGEMWRQDGMEVFLAPKRGAPDLGQWVVTPGMGKNQAKLRVHFHDNRKTKSLKALPAEAEFARTKRGNTAVIEGCLPWSSLAIQPELGREVAVQVFFGETDKDEGREYIVGWYPDFRTGALSDSKLAYTVRLAAKPHPPLAAYVTSHRFNAKRKQYEVNVAAQRDRSGRKVALAKNGKVLAEGTLEPDRRGRATGVIRLPLPAAGTRLGKLAVTFEGGVNDSVEMLDVNTARLLAAHAAGPPAVIDIGSRRELFVDEALIDRLNGAELRLHHPVPREKAVTFGDKPCEGPGSAYVTVFKDGDVFRMYFRGLRYDDKKKLIHQHTCYAESKDGIRWTRPDLGLYEYNGSKNNNIVWQGVGVHNFSPFKDTNPARRPGEEYKAVGIMDMSVGLFAFKSPDGIHWSMLQKEPIIAHGSFDSHNVAFWDRLRKEYVCYSRITLPRPDRGTRREEQEERAIQRCVSKDFLTWTEPVLLRYGEGTPDEQLYTNGIQVYPRAPHLFVGFPNRFMPLRKRVAEHPKLGVSGGLFMSSRDGLHWRRWREEFIRPGLHQGRWVDRVNMQALGLLFTKSGMTDQADEISMYARESAGGKQVGLRRYTLRVDGFVSVYAKMAGGEMVTKPLVFQGRQLAMNYSTSTAGSVRVEIQDEKGAPIEGYALGQCPPIYGDAIEEAVKWRGGSDVSKFAGKPIRLRFELKDADLYSIRFR